MSNKLADFLIKQSGYYIRYNSQKNAPYTPPDSNLEVKMPTAELGTQVQKPKMPKSEMPVRPGKNGTEPDKGYLYPLLHPWNNTISGTGFGNRYWAEPQNPLQP